MSKAKVKAEKPIICTFYMLQVALQSLHMYDRRHLDTLHDVWLLGAPTPDSRILQPAQNDPRNAQAAIGNLEKRIVAPGKLRAWMLDVAKARGIDGSAQAADKLIDGMGMAWGQQ